MSHKLPHHAAGSHCIAVFVGAPVTPEVMRAWRVARQAFLAGVAYQRDRAAPKIDYLKRRVAELVEVNRELKENRA